MKHLITESRLNQVIEKYLYNSYDYIVSVSFQEKSVLLGHENEMNYVTTISIIIDPYKILDGNIKTGFKGYNSEIRRELWNNLNSFFGLGLGEYGSAWDVEVYGITLHRI